MDEAARAQQDLHQKARTVLMVRAITAQPGLLLPLRKDLRPHTRVFLKDGERANVISLGIVFKRWDEKWGGITFTQKGGDGAVLRQGRGQFANDRSGQEMGLIVDARWIWDDLIRQYKGLSHGNM